MPFGYYGYGHPNDPRAPRFFERLLTRNFKAAFLNNPPTYTKPEPAATTWGGWSSTSRVEHQPAVPVACRAPGRVQADQGGN